MIMTIQQYRLVVMYKPGNELVIVNHEPHLLHITPMKNMNIDILSISEQKHNHIKNDAQNDQCCIMQGWHEVPTPAKPYWNYRDTLSTEAGIILRGE